MRVSSTDFQNAVGRYLSWAQKEAVIITKNGKSVAKLTAFNDPEEFLVNESKDGYNVKRRIDHEEYQEIIDNSDRRYELIDGEIYLLASPSFAHQVIVRDLIIHLQNFLQNETCQALKNLLYKVKSREVPAV